MTLYKGHMISGLKQIIEGKPKGAKIYSCCEADMVYYMILRSIKTEAQAMMRIENTLDWMEPL